MYKRVCTHARFSDLRTGRSFRVFNTHFPLVAEARTKSARLIARRLAGAQPSEPTILAGDFNCAPIGSRASSGTAADSDSSAAILPFDVFAKAGLLNAELAAGGRAGTPTFHLYGVALACLDWILVSREWRVVEHRVVRTQAGGVRPSDHFGVLAALELDRKIGPRSSQAKTPVARITVEWQDTHQTIVGFGGTMGWIHPGERVREEVFDLLFTKLGASVLRIRALGGEGDDELSIEPKNDNDDPNAFNWPAFPVYLTEAKNAVIIKGALARGVRTVVPASWSPPAWMKTTGERAGGGRGTLKEGMIEEFAEAWAAYVIGMKREFEIDIRTLSVQNEPDLTWYYPTCGFTPALYARAVRAVQARLDREKLKVSVLGPDVCRIYNLGRYLEKLDEAGYERGGEGRKALPVLTHLYDLSIDYGEVGRDAERWRAARDLARERKRPLWFMETANYLSVSVEKGSYEEAIIWARKIHHALADGDCQVVCYWSLFFDKTGEALIYCRETGLDEYRITPKFYSSMNYFRFVRPGMRRVTASSADPDIFVTAFAGERSRVVVIVNWADAAKAVRLPLAANETWQRFETTGSRKCERVRWAPPAAELPSRSVTTFVRTARPGGNNNALNNDGRDAAQGLRPRGQD